MNNVRLKLSPPWITYVNKLTALFDCDPMIAFNVNYGGENGPEVTLAVGGNGDKATAIRQLLPMEKVFGNITLRINVDGNMSNRAFTSSKELFEAAFEKNPAFSYAVAPAMDGYWWPPITYVVFKNCVVQFFNDNLNDCHGLVSTLYEEIARDVFEEYSNPLGNVYYNTDVEIGKLGKPLGEWP